MPFGDGTGPYGKGPKTGRGLNKTCGQGKSFGNRTGGGPQGNCVCPKCGYSKEHKAGVSCNAMHCPKCGIKMQRG